MSVRRGSASRTPALSKRRPPSRSCGFAPWTLAASNRPVVSTRIRPNGAYCDDRLFGSCRRWGRGGESTSGRRSLRRCRAVSALVACDRRPRPLSRAGRGDGCRGQPEHDVPHPAAGRVDGGKEAVGASERGEAARGARWAARALVFVDETGTQMDMTPRPQGSSAQRSSMEPSATKLPTRTPRLTIRTTRQNGSRKTVTRAHREGSSCRR